MHTATPSLSDRLKPRMSAWLLLAVKSPEIIDTFFEAFRAFVAPVLECLDGSDVAEGFLRKVLVIDLNIALDGLGQRLGGVEAGGGQDL